MRGVPSGAPDARSDVMSGAPEVRPDDQPDKLRQSEQPGERGGAARV